MILEQVQQVFAFAGYGLGISSRLMALTGFLQVLGLL